MKKDKIRQIVPILLLGGLLVLALVTVFTQADNYGITIDEPLQDMYGQSLLSWYRTSGQDMSFMTAYAPTSYMPQHGAIFETIVAFAQRHAAQPWHVRALVTGLAGVVGVVAIALCGWELAGAWGALLAALSLWLYPRFFGAIFNNSKDIPFASAAILVLWAVLLLIRQWEMRWAYLRNSILVGFFIGFAASIRVNAVLWYPILALLPIGWWLYNGKRVWKERGILSNVLKQSCATMLIVWVSLETMCLCWPYISLSPLPNLLNAVRVMRKFPWDGAVLFEGQIYTATHLPRSYAVIWLFIGSPPAVVIFAIIGCLIACATLVRRRTLDPRILIAGLALFLPLSLILYSHSTLYDTIRQILFLVPPMLLIAVYGFLGLVSLLKRKKWQIALITLMLLTVIAEGQLLNDLYDIHPYEYMYFSPLVGGVPGASDKYDMDYWGICYKPAAEWLARNYRQYTSKASPTVANSFIQMQIMLYLPANFRNDTTHPPDFYITSTRFGQDRPLSPNWPPYKTIHTESVQGYTACNVKMKL